MMVASHGAAKVEENEEKAPEPQRDFNQMARQVQNLFKFRSFYDQMDFDPN